MVGYFAKVFLTIPLLCAVVSIFRSTGVDQVAVRFLEDASTMTSLEIRELLLNLLSLRNDIHLLRHDLNQLTDPVAEGQQDSTISESASTLALDRERAVSNALVQELQKAIPQTDGGIDIDARPTTATIGEEEDPIQNSLWKNQYDIVHVITSRFMIYQPDLVHLGKARLDLFRTFTLPSIQKQTTKEFLWIIYTDPNLNPLLREPLVELVKDEPNVLVLGMNRARFDDFRNKTWMEDVHTVFSGSHELLKDYHAAAQQRVFVNSRVDADDAVYLNFCSSVQQQTAKALGETARLANYNPSNLFPRQQQEFLIICSKNNLEWGYFNPWSNHTKRGHLYGHYTESCVTAGLSYAYQVGFDSPDRVNRPHHKLNRVFRGCSEGGSVQYHSDTHRMAKNTTHFAILPDMRRTTNCLAQFDLQQPPSSSSGQNYAYATFRSRTPTSNGMANVLPTQEMAQERIQWKSQQSQAWDTIVEHDFGVLPQDIWKMRQRLEDNMVMLVQDSLHGQCGTTHKAGFSCKDSSKKQLRELLLRIHEEGTSSTH